VTVLLVGSLFCVYVSVAILVLARGPAGRSQPGVIMALGYMLVSLLAPFQGKSVTPSAADPARLISGQPLPIEHMFVLMSVVIGGVLSGAFLTSTLGIRGVEKGPRIGHRSLRVVRPPSWCLPLGAVPLLLFVAGHGLPTIMSSQGYLQTSGPPALTVLGGALSPAAILILSLFLRRTSGRTSEGGRTVSLFLIGLYALVFFASATRSLALLPLLVYGAYRLQSEGGRHARIAGVVALGSSLLFLNMVLRLRNVPGGGLAVYTPAVLSNPGHFFSLDTSDVWGNILFGIPLATYIALQAPPIPFAAFIASVSPLPSGLTGIGTFESSLRVQEFIPYNALGEVLQRGLVMTFVYFAVASATLGALYRRCANRDDTAGTLGTMLILGLSSLFFVLTLEYNLRSCTRILYYAAILVALISRSPSHRLLGKGAKAAITSNDLGDASPVSHD
jgi:hypothetical protein